MPPAQNLLVFNNFQEQILMFTNQTSGSECVSFNIMLKQKY